MQNALSKIRNSGSIPTMSRRPTAPRVQSLERSLEILETLGNAEELGLVEIAARTGLRPSTTHRLLATLAAHGYAAQNASNGRYRLGYRIAELAAPVIGRTERLRVAARSHLSSVQRITGESASLTVLELPNVVYVDQVQGTQSVRMFARIGAAVPAHTTAAGKAMLAFLEATRVRDFIDSGPLEKLTARTITSSAALVQALAQVYQHGYAVDDEEHEVGVGCVAAPIFDESAGVVAAISVSAPTPRIATATPAELGELLMDRAASISASLGRQTHDHAARAAAG